MTEIVTLTLNPAVDLSFSVERMRDTCKLRCDDGRRDAGGGGINVARVAHRLGADCQAIYTAGGATGRVLRALLETEAVPGCEIPIEGETRENVTVRETSTGKEYRFVLPGPHLRPHEWQQALDRADAMARGSRYLVASGSLAQDVPSDVYARLARSARLSGCRMVVDASGEALEAALAEGVYLVKPSLDELRELMRRPLTDEAEWCDAARTIVQRGQARVVALTLGDRGAWVITLDEALFMPGRPVPVVSAVGAGDSFLAALVWALARGSSAQDALAYGMAAGTAAVLNAGTVLAHASDIMRLYRGAPASQKAPPPAEPLET